jgi:CubicO group peptidase (beta-lactamase class C family)
VAAEPSVSPAALAARLDARIPPLMARYDVPGVSIALVRRGELVWSASYGYADRGRARPMTVEAVCRAESISKSVTAWGVLKLVERGVVGLDAPVRRYLRDWSLPESPYAEDSITVRRLLSGTAGMPLGTIGVRYPPEAARPSLRDALHEQARPVREPGSAFEYSNVGFNLLELLIEEVSGRPFAEYMADEVLHPLGMRRSSFAWNEGLRSAVPTGYDLEGRPVPVYVYAEKASGGLFTTLEDVARFAAAGRRGSAEGDAVLSEEGVRLLHTPQVEDLGIFGLVADGYGMGHFVETLPDGRRAAWHGGQGTGWMTHFHLVPETGDAIVILTNSQRSWPLMAQVLDDWARWSGLGSVRWSRLTHAVGALWIVVAALVLASLLQGYRLAAGLRRGHRRLVPLAREARTRPALQAVLAGAVISALAWAAAQPYLFVTSVFPGAAEWAGRALLLLAALTLLAALCPRARAAHRAPFFEERS